MTDDSGGDIDYRTRARERYSEAEKHLKKTHDEAVKQGGTMKELAEASRATRNSIESDGLSPEIGEYGEQTYSVEQGAKAACFAREDAATTLILQVHQLNHLRGIKFGLWACFGLLVYIAYRVG